MSPLLRFRTLAFRLSSCSLSVLDRASASPSSAQYVVAFATLAAASRTTRAAQRMFPQFVKQVREAAEV